MAKKNKTQGSPEVSKETAEVNRAETDTQSAQDELAELETDYKAKRKELRTVVRDENKSAIVDKGTELANELYDELVKIANNSGQKINRFTIRLGDDGNAIIKSAIVRLPKNSQVETVVEPDPEKQETVKAAAEKSGK